MREGVAVLMNLMAVLERSAKAHGKGGTMSGSAFGMRVVAVGHGWFGLWNTTERTATVVLKDLARRRLRDIVVL